MNTPRVRRAFVESTNARQTRGVFEGIRLTFMWVKTIKLWGGGGWGGFWAPISRDGVRVKFKVSIFISFEVMENSVSDKVNYREASILVDIKKVLQNSQKKLEAA